MSLGRQGRREGGNRAPGAGQLRAAMTGLELAQDVVTVLVGVALIVLAVALLAAAVLHFFRSGGAVTTRAGSFLDQILLVLILVEIVHTVMLSLRSHELQPEPFIVVALIAAIRKLLFVLGNQQQLSTSQFALFLSTAAVFIAALVAVRRWAPVKQPSEPSD
ncbi:MAG: phosphate-starvation-inducible PsiE family protein [Acidimicrobiales bacterium]